jgi:hypothetical protein
MAVAIALADDGVIVREGVARVLAAQPGIEVVVSCGHSITGRQKLPTSPSAISWPARSPSRIQPPSYIGSEGRSRSRIVFGGFAGRSPWSRWPTISGSIRSAPSTPTRLTALLEQVDVEQRSPCRAGIGVGDGRDGIGDVVDGQELLGELEVGHLSSAAYAG